MSDSRKIAHKKNNSVATTFKTNSNSHNLKNETIVTFNQASISKENKDTVQEVSNKVLASGKKDLHKGVLMMNSLTEQAMKAKKIEKVGVVKQAKCSLVNSDKQEKGRSNSKIVSTEKNHLSSNHKNNSNKQVHGVTLVKSHLNSTLQSSNISPMMDSAKNSSNILMIQEQVPTQVKNIKSPSLVQTPSNNREFDLIKRTTININSQAQNTKHAIENKANKISKMYEANKKYQKYTTEKVKIDLKRNPPTVNDNELIPGSNEKILLIQTTLLELLLTNKNKELVLRKVEDVYNNIVKIVNTALKNEKEENGEIGLDNGENLDLNDDDEREIAKQDNYNPICFNEEEEKNISVINNDFSKKDLISDSDNSKTNSLEKIISSYGSPDNNHHKSKHCKNSKSTQYNNFNVQFSADNKSNIDRQIELLERDVKKLKNHNKTNESKIIEQCKKNLAVNVVAQRSTNLVRVKGEVNKGNVSFCNLYKSPGSQKLIDNKDFAKKHKKAASVDIQGTLENHLSGTNNNKQVVIENKPNESSINNFLSEDMKLHVQFSNLLQQELMRIDESVNSYINIENSCSRLNTGDLAVEDYDLYYYPNKVSAMKNSKPNFIPKLEMESIYQTSKEIEERKQNNIEDDKDKEKKPNISQYLKIQENTSSYDLDFGKRMSEIRKPKSHNIKIEEVNLGDYGCGSEIIDLEKDKNYFEVNLQNGQEFS